MRGRQTERCGLPRFREHSGDDERRLALTLGPLNPQEREGGREGWKRERESRMSLGERKCVRVRVWGGERQKMGKQEE